MFEIAPDVHRWLATGQDVVLARVVSVSGLGSGAVIRAAARSSSGELVGGLLDSAADKQLASVLRDGGGDGARLVDVVVTDQQAVAAGLVCGGRARLIVQPATDLPAQAWDFLLRREPVCLVSDLDGPALGRTTWFGHDSSTDGEGAAESAALTRHTADVVCLFGRGSSVITTTQTADGLAVLVDALWPTPRLVVVGDGLLAEALDRLAAFLDWEVTVCTDVADGVAAVSTLTRGDAVVVLSHDRDVDGPVLQAALAGPAGYVAGLGSRRTPAQTALSILSEALAVGTRTDGRPLRERGRPVHSERLYTRHRDTTSPHRRWSKPRPALGGWRFRPCSPPAPGSRRTRSPARCG